MPAHYPRCRHSGAGGIIKYNLIMEVTQIQYLLKVNTIVQLVACVSEDKCLYTIKTGTWE